METGKAIFDFLAGERSTGAERVRQTVLDPSNDPKTASELVLFRKKHKDLLNTPSATKAVHAQLEKVREELDAAGVRHIEVAESIVLTPWQEFFQQLLSHVRSEFPNIDRPTTGSSADSVVSTVLSSYLSKAAAGIYGNLDDPDDLWAILLEITVRKTGIALAASAEVNRDFARGLHELCLRLFRDVSMDPFQRQAVQGHLLGKSAPDIAQATGYLEEDVHSALRAVHDELRVWLAAA